MRGLISSTRDSDPQAMAALAVIQAFDDLLARGVTVQAAVVAAEELFGGGLFVRDELNDRLTLSPLAERAASNAPRPPEVVPKHGADEVDGVVVAPVAVAEGRIGAVWTLPLVEPATELQRLVVERLAALVAVDARRAAMSAASTSRASAMDDLTAEGIDRDTAALIARRVGLPSCGDLLPVAARACPGIAAEALAALLARRGGSGTATTVAGRTVLLAMTAETAETAFEALEDPGIRGWDVRVAVGHPGMAHELASGWVAAREALAFTSPSSPMVRADDLGVLTLLGSMPRDRVLQAPDVRAVERVATRAGRDHDLTLLTRYCETGSLRETAAVVHLHHSSVEYRIRKLEHELGFGLHSPTGRMRALLAVRLWLVHRSVSFG